MPRADLAHVREHDPLEEREVGGEDAFPTSGDRVVHFRSHGAPAPRLPPRLRPSVAGCNVSNASAPIASTTGLRQSCSCVSYVKVRCVRSSARAARSAGSTRRPPT